MSDTINHVLSISFNMLFFLHYAHQSANPALIAIIINKFNGRRDNEYIVILRLKQ